MQNLCVLKTGLLTLFFSCFFWLPSALAQSSSVGVGTTASSVTKISNEADSTAIKPQLAVSLRSLNYLSASDVDSSSQGQAEFTLGFKKEGFLSSDVRLLIGSYSEPKTVYGTIPAAYFAVGSLKENFVAVGIKTQSLNFIDRYYHLGLYQSYQTTDYIEYNDQGFPGVQVQAYSEYFGLKAGYQRYFFPNQVPQVREDNGKISSTNRWAARPPPKFEFVQGQSKPIIYVIRDYKLSDIIDHPGYTASVFAGPSSERPWIQAAYAYHPTNDIPLTRETYGSVNDFTGHVNLSPVVTYSEVKSLDINLDRGIFKSTLSYVEDQPQNTTAVTDETIQFLTPMKVYGVYLAIDLNNYTSRHLEISVAAAQINGGEIKDITSDGKPSIFTFSTQRTLFKNPVTLGAAIDAAYIYSKPLETSLSWTYDRFYKGSLVSGKISYRTPNRIGLNAGFDLLGVEQETPVDTPSNFLSQNQANDRFFAGVDYAF